MSQPCELEWRAGGRSRRHVPDLLSLDLSGDVTVWDVKRPDAVDDAGFLEAMHVAEDACREVGWNYRLFTGLADVHRYNLMWLAGHRRRPTWAEAHEAPVTQQCSDGVHLGELMATDCERRAVVWHLLWRGRLKADLTARLTLTTVVSS